MKKIIIALLAVMAAVGCANDTAKYVIKGSGLEDGANVQLVDQITSEPIDSAVVAGGVFQLKGKAAKDAFLFLASDASDWRFPLFNDGTPVEVNFGDNTVTAGSELNLKLAECDTKTSDLMHDYNEFVEELMELPDEEVEARMPEYRKWIEKLRDCYLSVVEENQDNYVPVAFIEEVRSLAGPDKFNELLASDAVPCSPSIRMCSTSSARLTNPSPARRKPRRRSRPSSARSSSTSKRPIRTAICTS